MMVQKIIKLLTVLIFTLLLFNSCYYDKEEELYKYNHVINCDVSNVTYSKTIAPIMSANCNVCHSTSTAAGAIVLDNYTDLVKHMDRVWVSINLTGSSAMPKDGNMLTSCDINKIQAWKDKGTPND